jgi:hypothetical protein
VPLIQLPVIVLTLLGLVMVMLGIMAPAFEAIVLGIVAVAAAGVIAALGSLAERGSIRTTPDQSPRP